MFHSTVALFPTFTDFRPLRCSPTRGGPNDAVVFEDDRIYPSPNKGNLAVTAFGNVGVTGFLRLGRTVR